MHETNFFESVFYKSLINDFGKVLIFLAKARKFRKKLKENYWENAKSKFCNNFFGV